MVRTKHMVLMSLFGLMMTGCTMTRMAADQTASILMRALPAYDRETHLEFAEQAIAGNLKLLEGLLEVTPDNADLLFLASSGFARYAFAFIEERIDIADEQNDFEERDKLVAQAIDFYGRAREYGLRLLVRSRRKFPEALEQDLEHLSLELKHFRKRHVPALFWSAYAWGGIINLRQDDPEQLAQLPRVDLMMRRVLELDDTYFFGGVHLFYGAYYGGRPEMLGGDPVKARQHLQRAIEISNGTYLMAKFMLAKYYAVPVQDRDLFEQTLREIISAPPDLFPEQGLANQWTKRNAERWLKRADKLFLRSFR